METKLKQGNVIIVAIVIICLVILSGLIFVTFFHSKTPANSTNLQTTNAQPITISTKPSSASVREINYSQSPAVLDQTAVVLINFSNDKSQPFTKKEVEEAVFSKTNPISAYRYFQENSYNQFSLKGDVYGWYTLPLTNENCNIEGWKQEADKALGGSGVDLQQVKHFIYIHPKTTCNWGGAATTIGTIPSVNYMNGIIDSYSIIHEFAHNLGLGHAGFIDCAYNEPPKSVGPYDQCSLSSASDPFDPMGHTSNLNQINAPHKVLLGWIPQSNIKTVESNGVFTLLPIEIKTNGLQVLKVKKPDTNDQYYLEYRQPIGLDKNLQENTVIGTNITIFHPTSSGGDLTDTYFIDTTPKTPHNFYDGALADNTPFYDQDNGITIKQLSHDKSSAKISIKFGN